MIAVVSTVSKIKPDENDEVAAPGRCRSYESILIGTDTYDLHSLAT